MSCNDMTIRPEQPADAPDINDLHDEAFGPGRFAKTAYRVREGSLPVEALSLVAMDEWRLVGSIRFSRINIGEESGALLLGPLAIFRDYGGHRCGLRLMGAGLELAGEQGFSLALLVGDLAYYQKVGFKKVPAGQIRLPGPVDAERLLAFEIEAGALAKFQGMVAVSRIASQESGRQKAGAPGTQNLS